ncbi:MAG: phosphopentomutase [Bacillota bacterium]
MRAIVIVLDSVGVGAAADAARYGDAGANTLGHLLERFPAMRLPNLWSLGLGCIVESEGSEPVQAMYGRMQERSAGKDSMTGHWELAGVITGEPFAVFERFPGELVRGIESEAGVQFMGNCAASGTQIIEEFGESHMQTGRPILYTSADSVLQIAAHEAVIPCPRLYEVCRVARRHADAYRIGRVIARPFVGERGAYLRTGNRHDFTMYPPRTILDAISEAGLPVKAVGKAGDLFAGQGISQMHPTVSNTEGMVKTQRVWNETEAGLVFVNFVDFDTLYGHRRDPGGYAEALVQFDRWVGEFLRSCSDEDLVIITADHGNDPTFRGTDHTREDVPVMVRYRGQVGDLGCRATFADVAATLAGYFGVSDLGAGGTAMGL